METTLVRVSIDHGHRPVASLAADLHCDEYWTPSPEALERIVRAAKLQALRELAVERRERRRT